MSKRNIRLTNLPDDLVELINEKSDSLNLSPNQFVKTILEEEMLSVECKELNERLLKYLAFAIEIIEENTYIIKSLYKEVEECRKKLKKDKL